MRNKRLIYLVLSLFVIVGGTTVSCKKGENDPFLSLRSRKARISGKWKLKEGTVIYTANFGGVPTSETTNYTETSIEANGNTTSYSETLTIDKNGTYSLNTTEGGNTVTVSGVWFFAGKIKDLDLKNKEAIILSPQSSTDSGITETVDGLNKGEPLMIDQLKNDEMIFKGESSYGNGSGSGSNTSYEKRYEKQ